ncbi:hypothetical protein [Coleofasciculus chthonoplastes]|uniref:hypothetical protein n=1 Tax=Coleofasciculus chthonoplastes TaxID=64178 RepID=UPI0018DE9EB4|nr:hypothetical protein [Coleofasciculus chthonoplastes]
MMCPNRYGGCYNSKLYLTYCLLPIAYCLLPIAYSLFPIPWRVALYLHLDEKPMSSQSFQS